MRQFSSWDHLEKLKNKMDFIAFFRGKCSFVKELLFDCSNIRQLNKYDSSWHMLISFKSKLEVIFFHSRILTAEF